MFAMKHAYLGKHYSDTQELASLSLNVAKPLIKVLMLNRIPLVALLNGTGISVEDFTRADKKISYSQYHELAANACRLSQDTSFAWRVGEQSGLHYDSLLAGRIMSSENVEQSLELLTRYQSLFMQTLKLEFSVNANGGVLSLFPLFELNDALPYFVELTCSIIYSLGRFYLGGKHLDPDMAEIHLTYPQPESWQFYQDVVSVPVLFNQPTNRIKFSRKLLDLPLVFSNQNNAQQTDKACQARVSEIGVASTLTDRVKFFIHKHIQSDLSLEQVAEHFCVSPRTLRRYLHEQNTSYKALVEAERKRVALIQIKQSDMSIENIAFGLGYGEASSFSRAFKRWYGVSPKTYRG